jgi:ParB-like nuclease domain
MPRDTHGQDQPTWTPIPVDQIDPNPYRDFDAAPPNDEAIQASMEQYLAHNHLPGVMRGRMRDNRVQLAYGHRRLEAARRLGLPMVDVVIDDLTDDQMIALMPTEHGEHAKRDFSTCLVAWLACAKFCAEDTATDIARRFGWTYSDPGHSKPRMNGIARACNKCADAIRAEKAEIKDFKGMPAYRAQMHAVMLTKSKRVGFFLHCDLERDLGVKGRVIQEAKAGPSSWARPFRFEEEPENIGAVVTPLDTLIIGINRLVNPRLPNQLRDLDDSISLWLGDLAKSHHVLKTDEARDKVEEVREALERAICRASDLIDRLSPPEQGNASPVPEKDTNDNDD